MDQTNTYKSFWKIPHLNITCKTWTYGSMNRGSTSFIPKFAGNFLQPQPIVSPSTVIISLLIISIGKKPNTVKQIKFYRNFMKICFNLENCIGIHDAFFHTFI